MNQGNGKSAVSTSTSGLFSANVLPLSLFSLIPSILDHGQYSLSHTSLFKALLLNPCSRVAYPCSHCRSCMARLRMSRNRGMEFAGVAALLCNIGTIVNSGTNVLVWKLKCLVSIIKDTDNSENRL